MSKPQLKKYKEFLDNQFEISLKEDFLPLYLRPNYEHLMRPGTDLGLSLGNHNAASRL